MENEDADGQCVAVEAGNETALVLETRRAKALHAFDQVEDLIRALVALSQAFLDGSLDFDRSLNSVQPISSRVRRTTWTI